MSQRSNMSSSPSRSSSVSSLPISLRNFTPSHSPFLLVLLTTALLLLPALVTAQTPPVPDDSSSSNDSWKDLICAVVIALASVLLILVCYRIYVLRRDADSSPSTAEGGQVESDETTKRNWKIDFNDIELGAVIGQGSIGKVFKGKWRGLTVAVKEVTHNAKEDAVAEELSILIRVRHPNLCLFMGLAMPAADKLYLVSEHMARGNLYTVLHDKAQKLDWKRRIAMALDAARAMNYLHCSNPPILHKNLNSINLLVDKELVTKVCDYAVDTIRTAAKKSGVYTQPLWIAPELFKKGKHSKASDAYSFGIVLWEIVTRKTPYQGMIKGGANHHVKAIQDITNGMRPMIPDKCPPKMANLMTRCWAADASTRPSFQQIVEELSEMEKEKSSAMEAANNWLKNQAELEEIAIQQAESESLEALLSGENKKSWMVGSAEIKYDEKIGYGSFGEVWSGMFRGKKVAIKKLQAEATNILKGIQSLAAMGKSRSATSASGGSALRDFIKELNMMCSLRHPNCVLFMGACLEEGNYCIIMEYCAKGNLFHIIHDVSQPIDYNMIIKILTEVAEGILYLHLNKPQAIIHRDLKSMNVLVDEDWNIKVSDFGLTDFKPDSSNIDGASAGGGGTSGALQIGTPFWQAPETMEKGEFSESSDCYSFGMIVYELFTREIPFQNMNPHQAALAVIADDKRPDIPNFVPPKFVDLIQSCWLRNPKQRPAFPQILERLAILKREGLPRIELSLSNAKLYRKKTMVFAFKSKDAVIVYKPWGTGESKAGDWVLVGPGDDVYTCDAVIFQKTYSLVDPTKPHLYRKTGSIFALEMERDFLMETLEGMEHGSKGDFIAQNPVDGEQWPIASKTFLSMYELAPSQQLPPEAIERAKQRAAAIAAGQNANAAAAAKQLPPLQEEKHEETNGTSESGLVQRKTKTQS